MEIDNYIVHVAGEFEDGIQVCTMCGTVLIDMVGVSMLSYGDTVFAKPAGFAEGVKVYVQGTTFSILEPERRPNTVRQFIPCVTVK